MLWIHWWNLVCELRPACARTRTFLWMSLCLAGISTRKDLLGVTSIVRTLGLEPACYDRLLDFFHSPALDLNQLTRAWCELVFRFSPGILRVNGWPVLAGDGIKVAKAGRKMPGVKKLHQQSDSNTKPEYIFGHSCQAVAVLTHALSSVFALPLACRIHEGTVFSNRDHRTLLDKMILLLDSLDLKEPFYFVADAYYASGKIVRRLLARGNHLVTRVKSNSVACFPAAPPPPHRPRRRGRPPKYAKKIKVAALLKEEDQLQEAPGPEGAPRLWRAGGDPPFPGRRPIVAPARHPRPLRRGTPSSARRYLADVHRPDPGPLGHHPHLWLAIQDRSLFQAGPSGYGRICLSLLDGGHDATAA
ncbi:MAG: transposase, partial [Verrucomicrobia bacterium]|nr:transposase [Verrucomicrobiota bacterium]